MNPRRWTVAEFHRLWELGVFEGRKTILLNGEIIEMPPPGPQRNKSVGKVDYALKRAFAGNYWVRVQLPMPSTELSTDLVPDVAVVEGIPDEYDGNPSNALLVVDVSESTLEFDLGDKAVAYAAARVPDYWVVDLANRLLHVHRDPQPEAGSKVLFRYQSVVRLDNATSIAPLAMPNMFIAVGELLPKV